MPAPTLTVTVAEVPSEPTASKVARTASSTDRLNEEAAVAVLEIAVDNMMKHNMFCAMEIDTARAMSSDLDVEVVSSARQLWRQIVQRTIVSRVRADVVRRKLLPVTIHTLCSLLFDALDSFQ